MKKTYIKPQIKSCVLKVQTLLNPGSPRSIEKSDEWIDGEETC